MCNCTNKEGFAKAVKNAIALENKTGKAHGVFNLHGVWYFGLVKDVEKRDDICCYQLTDGTEKKIPKKEPAKK